VKFLKGFPSITREQAEVVIQLAAENFLTAIVNENIA